jgi:uncharacterized protein YndB with AHSA1/START domain
MHERTKLGRKGLQAEGRLRLRPFGGYEAHFERQYDQRIEDVWDAITNPKRMVDWLADTDLDLREGGKIELRFANSGAVTSGIVTEVEAPEVLEYYWVTAQQEAPTQHIPDELRAGNGTCGDNTLAASVIRYLLKADVGGGTVLNLRHTVPLNPDLIPNRVVQQSGRANRPEDETPQPDMVLAAWETHLDLLSDALERPGNGAMSLSRDRSEGEWPWGAFEEKRSKYQQLIQ